MNKRLALLVVCLTVLVNMLVSTIVLAEISVGVNEGDWIEYNVVYTGTPPEYYPTWVKVEVQSVQGTSITLNVSRKLLDLTQDSRNLTFDLETGAEDLIVIPADLNVDDRFFHENVGNITIGGVEDMAYAGARRTVVYATVSQIEFRWDKGTGFLLEATQSTAEFAQNWKADKTNMWQPQLFGLDPIVFYVLIIVAIVIVATVAFFIIRGREPSPTSP